MSSRRAGVGTRRTKEDGIRLLARGEGRRRQRVLVVVDSNATKVVRLDGELELSVLGEGVENLDGLSSHLGACARESQLGRTVATTRY